MVGGQQQTYSISEAVRILGLSRPSVQRAMRRGELAYFKLGGKYLIPRQAVDSLLKGGKLEAQNHKATVSNYPNLISN